MKGHFRSDDDDDDDADDDDDENDNPGYFASQSSLQQWPYKTWTEIPKKNDRHVYHQSPKRGVKPTF